ncbi:hypothetical protein [Asaia bogorensis]|uniref:Uncharacterized protein n=1 Tax=Asaia bogorensis NBRC 16594 TaxID=1231624 RepID=A0AAN4R109_9PROT|nr:hypothetical protein [Asaia bogorensis]BAT18388.1 hypothetical protein Asbog_00071 [Asaia bogorensis NBRC 16594]GBQ74618.1 hypothetical protein AA0311_0593 [Asaia bogorensis NBRC 16594]GEL52734.1 hypothetical protein ABO01nite_07410 [Asaia bogorensis NBRC 16594]
MPKFAPFVLERSNNPGTGPFALSGAPPGRRGWSGVFEDGEVYYFADDGTKAEWGIGRLTHGQPAMISRDQVLGNTFDRQDRLNFTGLVYVYSDIPVEAITPPATQGRVSIPGAELDDQRRDFFSQDIRVSGITLKAEFAGIIQLKDWGGVTATDWGFLQIVCSLYRLRSDGSAAPYTAEQRRLRVDRNGPMPIIVNAMAVNLDQGETVRAVITIVTLKKSRQDFTFTPALSDAALTWLSV